MVWGIKREIGDAAGGPAGCASAAAGQAVTGQADLQPVSELHALLLKQNWTALAAAINGGADANERNADGTPIITSVARWRFRHPAALAAEAGAAETEAGEPGQQAEPGKRATGAIGPDEIVAALIRHGADVNAAEGDGGCALLSAVGQNARGLKNWVYRDDLPLVRLLIEAGADVNAHFSEYPTSALMLAARCGSLEIITLLLDRGADPAWRGDGGCTALHFAVSAPWLADRPEVVDLLLARGADKAARDLHGDTPADYARRHGHLASLALLR